MKGFLTAVGVAVLTGTAHCATVRMPGWHGAPVEFSVNERFRMAEERRVALDLDMAADGAWLPSCVQASCERKTSADGAYVKIGGGDKRVGHAHGVKPAKPVALAEESVCNIDVLCRVANKDDTLLAYIRVMDSGGRDVTDVVPAPAGWEYSIYSKRYVKTFSLDEAGKWTTVNMPFTMPRGVTHVVLEICPFRGMGADVRGIRVDERRISGSRAVAFDVRKELDGGAVRFTSARDALAIEVRPVADGSGKVSFDAEVADLSTPPKPRALDVVVKVPAALVGWMWHRNWRDDRLISGDSRFSDAEAVGGFEVSRYPFSAVSKGGAGFLFGTPIDGCHFESRIVAGDGIESRLPVGLLERGGKGRGTRARFRWLLIPFKGTWGFRSAAKAYYAHEAGKFMAVPKNEKEGTWIWPIWPSKGPDSPDDFGLAFWEAPTTVERTPEEIRRAHELGIGVYPYTEVWGMRQTMTKSADGSHPPLECRIAELEKWAAQTNSGRVWFDVPREEAARACLTSMPVRPDGTHAYAEDFYSSWATWWRTNPDPRLAKPNRASICWDNLLAPRLDEVDGVYLDSVCYESASFLNVRPEHLAVFDGPLIYDRASLQPCAEGIQHMGTFISWLAERLHRKGKRIFGNVLGLTHRFHAANIDIFGFEVGSHGMKPSETHLHSAVTDTGACVQRFYAYHRPVSNLLQEGHYTRLCPEVTRRGMEMYIENHMFYGFYPAVSTIGGEKKIGYNGWRRYFDSNGRYERDRDIFKSAIPVIRRLNRAGWQPETLMRSSVANVLVERYGGEGSSECLFTVRNASEKTVDAVLSPEIPIASLSSVWRGSVAPQKVDGGFELRLDPWQTAVFKAE